MTRPKVPPEKRIRTAQACETCKRRKQKPCNTCSKRSLDCTYIKAPNSDLDHLSPLPSATPAKRRHVDDSSPVKTDSPDINLPDHHSPTKVYAAWSNDPSRHGSIVGRPRVDTNPSTSTEPDNELLAPDHEYENHSRNSTVSGPDEETSLLQSTRMLQDPTGRLLYVGDSASLAYLQLIRMIVETRTGPNDFTTDPSRHKIMEPTISMPANVRPSHILPDQETAKILVASFFTNALSLMAVYMLAVSKRNAAYAYFGMAVRSAFALGLHRVQENHSIFTSEDVRLRRNLWRSLFVLDRFLAASLGRPAAIAEDECSDDALMVFEKNDLGELTRVSDTSSGLDAAVRSCQVIGQILKKIYARRRISLRLAHEIAEQCQTWSSTLHPDLHCTKVRTGPWHAAQGIAALHVNLLYSHSILLLTRPFFICQLSKVHNERSGVKLPVPRWVNRMSKYCEACFAASTHTIDLVQQAYESNYLPQRNPFVFLIVLSNEFGSVYANPSYELLINNSITIMQYCAKSDPQANRLLYILISFKAAVAHVREQDMDTPALPGPTPLAGGVDPMVGIFTPSKGPRRSSFVSPVSAAISANRAMAAPRAPLAMKMESTPHPSYGIAGVSPASSGAVSSGGRDTDMGDNELDFDNLWGPWTPAPTSAVSAVATNDGPSTSTRPMGPGEARTAAQSERGTGPGHIPNDKLASAYGRYGACGIISNGDAMPTGHSIPSSSSLFAPAEF
ncbi:fungal specific transcription factor domain-containing protein [Verticillium dahliae VdLs.17]|uniref:Fungal specific transcription factor domain-containing protein n=1 Tax=Verticillium dahliae (strain VdLs.17 / ATCC MYA-4575 / FGSC 10137) TaxID=498257 RepID=G2X7F4_VERDV|nr:fungal specific transcription factor domain-containing protein [Verticillium dahliae VdLs.17]EGY14922.1 fungal specific transcription factor domain-containing protein [Verticillium dahliae VdLs.17]KAH6694628.1 fungal-specific transcription factor domain-containing protein [Verticillium dahliae]